MILCVRTDKPEAELYVFRDGVQQSESIWVAHRQLSVQILAKIESVLVDAGGDKSGLTGIVAYKGPGSFTGLRIGLSVANAMADGLNIPIVSTTGETWIDDGIERLQQGENESIALPEYGGDANITKPRK